MLEIRPTHLKPAREFVGKYHRHNIPPVGGKFAISCFEGERLCGVAICGRPTARKLDDGTTLEIYRNCTDGTRNACTKLYGACVRIARDMGDTRRSLPTRWRAKTALPFERQTSHSQDRRAGSLGQGRAAAITTYRRKK